MHEAKQGHKSQPSHITPKWSAKVLGPPLPMFFSYWALSSLLHFENQRPQLKTSKLFGPRVPRDIQRKRSTSSISSFASLSENLRNYVLICAKTWKNQPTDSWLVLFPETRKCSSFHQAADFKAVFLELGIILKKQSMHLSVDSTRQQAAVGKKLALELLVTCLSVRHHKQASNGVASWHGPIVPGWNTPKPGNRDRHQHRLTPIHQPLPHTTNHTASASTKLGPTFLSHDNCAKAGSSTGPEKIEWFLKPHANKNRSWVTLRQMVLSKPTRTTVTNQTMLQPHGGGQFKTV